MRLALVCLFELKKEEIGLDVTKHKSDLAGCFGHKNWLHQLAYVVNCAYQSSVPKF